MPARSCRIALTLPCAGTWPAHRLRSCCICREMARNSPVAAGWRTCAASTGPLGDQICLSTSPHHPASTPEPCSTGRRLGQLQQAGSDLRRWVVLLTPAAAAKLNRQVRKWSKLTWRLTPKHSSSSRTTQRCWRSYNVRWRLEDSPSARRRPRATPSRSRASSRPVMLWSICDWNKAMALRW